MEDNTLEDLLNATFFALQKEGRFEEAKLVEQMMKKDHNHNSECSNRNKMSFRWPVKHRLNFCD